MSQLFFLNYFKKIYFIFLSNGFKLSQQIFFNKKVFLFIPKNRDHLARLKIVAADDACADVPSQWLESGQDARFPIYFFRNNLTSFFSGS